MKPFKGQSQYRAALGICKQHLLFLAPAMAPLTLQHNTIDLGWQLSDDKCKTLSHTAGCIAIVD
jgi:hypothetical protein